MSKELKVLELFSGIGSQHKALTNIGIKSICTQCDKVKACGISDSQCYKQAGNSIVVNCLMAIFTNMFKDTDYMDSSENRGV